MKKATLDFLDFIDRELILSKIDIDLYKTYLENLPSIYKNDINFRLLFDWHFKLKSRFGNCGIDFEGEDKEDKLFAKQVDLIYGIGELYGLGYQYREIVLLHSRIGLRDKHLLEIGGALPNDLIFDHLGIAKYTNIESPEYIEVTKEKYYEKYSDHPHKRTILTNAEFIYEHIEKQSVDVIFSVACFEHIHDLSKAIRSCYSVLKENGYLYSYFAPIYSYLTEGDHGVIPSHKSLSEKPVGFHLLSQDDQYLKLIELGIKDQHEIDHFLDNVNSNRYVNRKLSENYIQILTESPFWVVDIEREESFNISKSYPSQIEEIRKSNKNISDLMTSGFRVMLVKF